MYGRATLGAAAVGGALAVTGLQAIYWVCAGFALLAAGMALVGVAPRLRLRRR
jgi:hypothetical protein